MGDYICVRKGWPDGLIALDDKDSRHPPTPRYPEGGRACIDEADCRYIVYPTERMLEAAVAGRVHITCCNVDAFALSKKQEES